MMSNLGDLKTKDRNQILNNNSTQARSWTLKGKGLFSGEVNILNLELLNV